MNKNTEIIQELFSLFQVKQVEFELFDKFKWQLKGLKDQVITDEEFKQIKGFNYSISSYGRVRNDKNNKFKTLRYHRWILQTDIYKDGKRYTIDIPRTVAEYYIRELKETEKVRYIDGDRRNNYYMNLEIINR